MAESSKDTCQLTVINSISVRSSLKNIAGKYEKHGDAKKSHLQFFKSSFK